MLLLSFILFIKSMTHLLHDMVCSTGEFQGPALVAVLEGTILSREEVSSLQFLPPWRLRGNTLDYGLGLLSCYSVCDLLSMVSGGYFYIFDPRGSAFAVPPSRSPAAKVFSLTGTLFMHHLVAIVLWVFYFLYYIVHSYCTFRICMPLFASNLELRILKLVSLCLLA